MKRSIVILFFLISQLSFAQISKNGLVAYYKFSGNTKDSSGNSNDGINFGATPTTDRFGTSNSAYRFDGVSNYILVPRSASIEPTQAVSLGAWIYAESNNAQWIPILDKRWNTTNDPWSSYGMYATSGNTPAPFTNKYFNGFSNGIAGTGKNCVSTSSIASNGWVFLVSTYDGANLKFYVNGVLESTVAMTGSIGYSSMDMYIANNSEGTQWFKGAIDDITIHNRAISQNEITNMYNNTTTSIPTFTKIQEDISVYPNPFENFITIGNISNSNDLFSAEIFDLAGKLILSSDENKISTESLPKGFYFLTVKTNNKTITTKIQKN